METDTIEEMGPDSKGRFDMRIFVANGGLEIATRGEDSIETDGMAHIVLSRNDAMELLDALLRFKKEAKL
jgi:hypothetical protein